ncbi:MAG: hypothetical protein IIB44_11850 [Candidatus Marinimicrobia bacterium]|nr:hypothetical protein [Candidatus Neomarinimicrobiota bacterium]MCH8068190.1 hypothetical protein [Candidatus Neomarinimicrobiota bacterium]
MKEVFEVVNKWIGDFTQLLAGLVVLGLFVGILFDDYFGVIAGVGRVMSQIGEAGLVGLLTLIVVVMWYQKK